MSKRIHGCLRIVPALVLAVLVLLDAGGLGAQETMSNLSQPSTLAAQSLRPYWHVFIAYAIAIVMVLGWVVSISRRLRDVEDRLGGR